MKRALVDEEELGRSTRLNTSSNNVESRGGTFNEIEVDSEFDRDIETTLIDECVQKAQDKSSLFTEPTGRLNQAYYNNSDKTNFVKHHGAEAFFSYSDTAISSEVSDLAVSAEVNQGVLNGLDSRLNSISSITSEVVGEEEMDIWDMLEKQALEQSAASSLTSRCNSTSSVISQVMQLDTRDNSGSSISRVGSSSISSGGNVSKDDDDEVEGDDHAICLRLKVLAIQVEERIHTKFVTAQKMPTTASNNRSSDSKKKGDIFTLELRSEWFYSDLNVNNIVHVINISKSDLVDKQVAVSNNYVNRVFPANICIDRENYLLIINPDVLLSPSTISEVKCTRRAVISEKFKAFGPASIPGTLGALKHNLVEEVTRLAVEKYKKNGLSHSTTAGSSDILILLGINDVDLEAIIQDIYSDGIIDIASAGLSEEDVKVTLICLLPVLKDWIAKLIESFANPGSASNKIECVDIPGVEEVLWSPALGLKGQIDLLGTSNVSNLVVNSRRNVSHNDLDGGLNSLGNNSMNSSGNSSSDGNSCDRNISVFVPIEIKTGKKKPSVYSQHRAQVIFYILMLLMRDKCSFSNVSNDNNSNSNDSIDFDWKEAAEMTSNPLSLPLSSYLKGYLVYISEEERDVSIELIKPNWIEIVSLIIIRNSVAIYSDNIVKSSSQVEVGLSSSSSGGSRGADSSGFCSNLPDILRSKHDCEFCFQSAECMVTYAAIDGGNEESSGVAELYNFVIGDVSKVQLDYFKDWDRLINLENIEIHSWQNKIWSCSSELLESMESDCIGKLFAKDLVSREGSDACTLSLQRTYTGGPNLYSKRSSAVSSVATDVDIRQFGIQVGDYVYISLENVFPSSRRGGKSRKSSGLISSALASGGASSTAVDIEDIENIGVKRNKTQYFEDISVGTVQPNIGAGYISRISSDSVDISISHVSFQLKLYMDSNSKVQSDSNGSLFIRIDKNNSPVFLRTLRSNLISLYTGGVSTFNFRKTKANTNSIVSNRTSTVADVENTKFVSDNRDRAKNLRELIIDMRKPLFVESDHILTRVPPERQDIVNTYNSLNPGQAAFINQLVCAEDYLLLQGLPGTGKTSIVALAVALLLLSGKRILLTSYTHSAIDNILMKIREYGFQNDKIIRIGNASDIHPKTMMYHFDHRHCKDIDEIKHKFESSQLIACTVLAASRDIMQSFKNNFALFDWCIVDEAGQILQPAIFEAVGIAHKFLLSGDCEQLSPLVKSDEAKRRGMDVSLFSRLATAHPTAVFTLTDQYRMNKEIMAISNRLIYNNQMNCGLESTALSKFHLPAIDKIPNCLNMLSSDSSSSYARFDWLYKCLGPDTPVLFLNTDLIDELQFADINKQPGSSEKAPKSTSANRSNFLEVYIIYILIASLKICKFKLSEVGVISVYRSQVKAIENLLRSKGVISFADGSMANTESTSEDSLVDGAGHSMDTSASSATSATSASGFASSTYYISGELASSDNCECEISTVDKFQGRDMEMIIFSSVQSKNSEVGNLLIDKKRINVAMTRAKTKFIILGSVELMRKDPLLTNLVELSLEKDWVINLTSSQILNYYEGF